MAVPSLEYLEKARVLRNLKVREISGVDRGAGRGVKVVLMKREDEAVDITKALPLWESFVDVVMRRDRCNRSVAYDRAAREQPDMLDMAKQISGAGTMLKLGGGGAPDGYRPTGPHDGSRQSSLGINSVPSAVAGEDNLSRLRSEHATKKYRGLIEKYRAQGMTQSRAIDAARAELDGEEWAHVKAARGTGPHDGSSSGRREMAQTPARGP